MTTPLPDPAPPVLSPLLTMKHVEPPPDIVAAAVRAAGHSKCRSQRGAALFTPFGLIVAGFNYRPDGGCDQSDTCKLTCRDTAIHAEQDAIRRARRDLDGAELLHVKVVSGSLVASGGPSCPQCSKLALACGIAAVWLFHENGWRRYETAEFHRLTLLNVNAQRATVARLKAELAEATQPINVVEFKLGDGVVAAPCAIEGSCQYGRAEQDAAKLESELSGVYTQLHREVDARLEARLDADNATERAEHAEQDAAKLRAQVKALQTALDRLTGEPSALASPDTETGLTNA